MSKTFKYVAGVFVFALFVSAIESTPAKAGTAQLPPNHEELAEICLCFGPFSNGVNATGVQRNGQCAASQTGPFCFVDTQLMPLFWKEIRVCRTTRLLEDLEPDPPVPFDCECPPGKMVLSCNGNVAFAPGEDNDAFPGPPAPNVDVAVFPLPNGTTCRLQARTFNDPFQAIFRIFATCASPGPQAAPR